MIVPRKFRPDIAICISKVERRIAKNNYSVTAADWHFEPPQQRIGGDGIKRGERLAGLIIER
jgi:hypothetical protein